MGLKVGSVEFHNHAAVFRSILGVKLDNVGWVEELEMEFVIGVVLVVEGQLHRHVLKLLAVCWCHAFSRVGIDDRCFALAVDTEGAPSILSEVVVYLGVPRPEVVSIDGDVGVSHGVSVVGVDLVDRLHVIIVHLYVLAGALLPVQCHGERHASADNI